MMSTTTRTFDNQPSDKQFQLALHVLSNNHAQAMLPTKGESIQEKASRWQEDYCNGDDNISIARMRWNRMIQIEDYLLRSFCPKKSVHDFGDELCLISRLVELTMFQLAKTIDQYDYCDDDFFARRVRVICCAHARKIVQARRIHKTLKQIRAGTSAKQLTRKCPAAGAA
mmetsp:Transcript_7086/g.10433  ORF Transcript_7086/g.10433 Transcript_7086/m.10433 type:complete len:170 (+) Transcript_7086:71-580(+)|eukprot:CAMPEP_0196801956 /NCGR_PEP_ID=MMETSP1362-20130617/1715_1 /TAXON_ID=163516 /ORGANISM="Leptocylindrus danicus, Strain CCMP1856" /LENGTH=169 /DNA_ID=CAMNT_0042173147 /DNA_START=74 /DNA_END=583 /DNA_ORIENTATION=-